LSLFCSSYTCVSLSFYIKIHETNRNKVCVQRVFFFSISVNCVCMVTIKKKQDYVCIPTFLLPLIVQVMWILELNLRMQKDFPENDQEFQRQILSKSILNSLII
jgi:hypothetical protein